MTDEWYLEGDRNDLPPSDREPQCQGKPGAWRTQTVFYGDDLDAGGECRVSLASTDDNIFLWFEMGVKVLIYKM